MAPARAIDRKSACEGGAARYYIRMQLLKLTLTMALGCAFLPAADEPKDTRKVNDRLEDAASLFSEVMATPDKAIPQGLLDKSQCIILVPGLKKGAFLVGGKYGRGFAVCRAEGEGWGPPAGIRIEGGSFGLQIGFASSDVVLLVMNGRGMKRLTQDSFTIGAEATAAAGPVGRDASAQTDAMMTAEILSWSRSHGAFAGVSLDGATLRTDFDQNESMYGKHWDTAEILHSGAHAPEAYNRLRELLGKYSPRKAI